MRISVSVNAAGPKWTVKLTGKSNIHHFSHSQLIEMCLVSNT